MGSSCIEAIAPVENNFNLNRNHKHSVLKGKEALTSDNCEARFILSHCSTCSLLPMVEQHSHRSTVDRGRHFKFACMRTR